MAKEKVAEAPAAGQQTGSKAETTATAAGRTSAPDLAKPLILGRKAFQKPMAEGVKLLNAIQDVFTCEDVTIA